MNKGLDPNNSSGFRGVSKESRSKFLRFRASLTYQDKHKYLGRFATAEEAARAYNIAALEYFGDFAVLNKLPGDK